MLVCYTPSQPVHVLLGKKSVQPSCFSEPTFEGLTGFLLCPMQNIYCPTAILVVAAACVGAGAFVAFIVITAS